ncbi:ATP-binding protein [Streptomyces fuscigenes]|uniref:ATP-binding protein n=1 Tax=Streptomyces fuscigenes TaxID=1528880 RepID=UPI001F1A856B|nr:ATP-binding protein [Streptomyces fuscigenes]MCF3961234.1 ATP-binding protein [Streptomyces fuscigenes]
MTAQHIQPALYAHTFTQRFAATRRGASLARKAAVRRLDAWGVPRGTELSDTVAVLVGELAANAVLHGYVPGRGFELRLRHGHGAPAGPGAVRIEVSDTHPQRPDPEHRVPADEDAVCGRGLQLVEALADRWGVEDRCGPGKTVWAETGETEAPPR